MAHFAQLDENNTVVQVIVIDNNATKDNNEIEQETIGVTLCKQLYGEETVWVQCSYNAGNGVEYLKPNAFRKNFPSIGSTYREDLDAFITIKPWNSWVLNETTCAWEAPVLYPLDGIIFSWNTETNTWDDNNGVIYLWDEDNQQWTVDPYQ
jgi:hypothetical protein